MINNFEHKGLKKYFEKGDSKLLPQNYLDKIWRILSVMNAADSIEGLNIPGFKLHPLKGNKKGSWSVSVTANYRITFSFNEGKFTDVDLEDYH